VQKRAIKNKDSRYRIGGQEMIQAKCPSCKKMFTVRINRMGKKVRCKFCGERFVLGGTPSS